VCYEREKKNDMNPMRRREKGNINHCKKIKNKKKNLMGEMEERG
jgi:hypothetical protein